MSLSVIIRQEAEAEMAEAFRWYEDRVTGLGSEFLLAVGAVLEGVARNPRRYPVVHKTIRRALLRRFPYGVFFVPEPRRIVVLAVFHAKRNPRRWMKRV